VSCLEPLRLQAYFDGELDALAAAEIERHLEQCPQCRALQTQWLSTRQGLRRELTYARVSAALAARLEQGLDLERPQPAAPPSHRWRERSFWMGALSGVGLSAVAATLAVFVLLPLGNTALIDDLVSAHLRSLMPTHLIDVVSSERHTVKPWFAGRADVSPAVADFEPQGYKLLGGRTDYLDHQRAAVIVYQHGAHIINVFSWAADRQPVPHELMRNGYHLLFWRTGNLQYCAVSDTAREELLGLAQLIQGLSAGDAAR
jgi:anti-sigma factor RsiW